jgi:hypothetical protein
MTGKLRSLMALLHLHLIDCLGKFPNEQSKLRYVFSRLEGATLDQMIHLMKDDYMNLENVKVFVTPLEEAYRDPDHVNATERALTKLCQSNRDFIMYYAEFQCLIMDLNWNHAAKCTALHHGLSEELKDILSI